MAHNTCGVTVVIFRPQEQCHDPNLGGIWERAVVKDQGGVDVVSLDRTIKIRTPRGGHRMFWKVPKGAAIEVDRRLEHADRLHWMPLQCVEHTICNIDNTSFL